MGRTSSSEGDDARDRQVGARAQRVVRAARGDLSLGWLVSNGHLRWPTTHTVVPVDLGVALAALGERPDHARGKRPAATTSSAAQGDARDGHRTRGRRASAERSAAKMPRQRPQVVQHAEDAAGDGDQGGQRRRRPARRPPAPPAWPRSRASAGCRSATTARAPGRHGAQRPSARRSAGRLAGQRGKHQHGHAAVHGGVERRQSADRSALTPSARPMKPAWVTAE